MSSLKQIPATTLTDDNSTSKEELGSIRVESNGKGYRYVRNQGCTTGAKGSVYVFRTSDNYSVSRSHTEARRNAFAGIGLGALTKGQYGWVQFSGFSNYLHTDAGVAAGEGLVVDSDTNNVADSLVSKTQVAWGRTIKADSGSILTAAWLGN